MGNREKIVIIGAGHVGSHCALALARSEVADEVVLVDLDEPKARAQALDISDALSFPSSTCAVRAGRHTDCVGANLVIVAIGEPRLPGQTRLDLLGRSVVLVDALVKELKPLGLSCPIVTITNPADVVADYLRRALGLPRTQVFGTGTLLDTSRLVRILSEKTGRSRSGIEALVLGEHGDSSVGAFSQVRIGGLPFETFGLDRAQIQSQTRLAGMDVINGKGSTEFGIGQVVSVLSRAILRDEKRAFPLSVHLEGEYGQHDVHCGVPCVVGRNGIESVVELDLSPDERTQFNQSCEVIRKHSEMAQSLGK